MSIVSWQVICSGLVNVFHGVLINLLFWKIKKWRHVRYKFIIQVLFRTDFFEVNLSSFDRCESAVIELIWGGCTSISVSNVSWPGLPVHFLAASERHFLQNRNQPFLLNRLKTADVRFVQISWYQHMHLSTASRGIANPGISNCYNCTVQPSGRSSQKETWYDNTQNKK